MTLIMLFTVYLRDCRTSEMWDKMMSHEKEWGVAGHPLLFVWPYNFLSQTAAGLWVYDKTIHEISCTIRVSPTPNGGKVCFPFNGTPSIYTVHFMKFFSFLRLIQRCSPQSIRRFLVDSMYPSFYSQNHRERLIAYRDFPRERAICQRQMGMRYTTMYAQI